MAATTPPPTPPVSGAPPPTDSDVLERAMSVWEKTIDVQIHFNDLELRIRNYAITILAAVLTGAALTLKDNISVPLWGWSVPAASLILGSGVLVWSAFYSMDAAWYHRLLLGAVEHGKEIERTLQPAIETIGLTTAIGDGSKGLSPAASKRRLHFFYLFVGAVLLGLALALFFGKVARMDDTAAPPPAETNQKADSPTP